MSKSIFTPYSFGMVVEDKEAISNEIKVFPIEHLGGYEGKLGESVDVGGVKKDNTILASWIPIGQSNRTFSPDVVVGETVLLYKFGESNMIYWDTIFHESDLRKKEFYGIMCSNTDTFKEQLNENNTYYNMIDTRNKKSVLIHISDNDGELTTYDIFIDSKKGEFVIQDGRGNFAKLLSKKDKWSIFSKGSVDIETKVVNVKCNDYNLECKNYTMKCTNQKVNSSNTTIVAKSAYKNNSTSSAFKGGSFKVTAPVSITGNFSVTGPSSFAPPISTGSTVAKT